MSSQGFWAGKYSKINVFALVCFLVAGLGLVYFKSNLFTSNGAGAAGLSGLVSVRGSVSLEQLDLSKQEIQAINQAVNSHKQTFSKVDMVVDAKGRVNEIKEDTVLVFAVVLKTRGELEVKSWSRKIERRVLVAQLVDYMQKASREYEEFQKFPDVQKNFKTLYI